MLGSGLRSSKIAGKGRFSMRRWFIFGGMVTLAVMMSGCASTAVYWRHTDLKIDPFSRSYDYSSVDFEVLGPVEAKGESSVLLGIVARGNEGYGLLMRAARQKYGNDATTVMFIFSDYSYEGIIFPLFGEIETQYYGTAVKSKAVSHTQKVRIDE